MGKVLDYIQLEYELPLYKLSKIKIKLGNLN
jgi:hypothetical protein